MKTVIKIAVNTFVFITIAVSQVIAVDPQGNTLCDPPTVTPVHFGDYVQIIVGSDHTFSCVIQSNTPLCEGFPKWGRRHSEPLPNHLINNGSCPTLPNATCSNLTLLNVSQSDGSGYYTITAENECGSDNFTVNVEIENPHYCLNSTEIPPLLIPPPQKILAVEGQTVTVSAAYKGDYSTHLLKGFWIVKTPNSEIATYIFPSDSTPKGYDVIVTDCHDTNPHFCCYFNISITIQSMTLEQSPTQLQSAAALSDDLTKYTAGHSKIDVLRAPIVVSFSGEECHNLTTEDSSTQFSCTYNASTDPNITITKWSVNDKAIPHNTSHYTLITEYGIDDLDLVKSTLIISNVVDDISGTYKFTCWCEYNKRVIYAGKVVRSIPKKMCLIVHKGSKSRSIPKWEIALIAGLGGGALVIVSVLVCCCCYCCYCCCKRKGKKKYSSVGSEDEQENLLDYELPSEADSKPLNEIAGIENKENGDRVEQNYLLLGKSGNQRQEDHRSNDPSQDEVVSDGHTSADLPIATLTPIDRDGTSTVQECPQASVNEQDMNAKTVKQSSRPDLKRFSTRNPIDSEKEAPRSEKPALTGQGNQEIVKPPTKEYVNNDKVLNEIVVQFTGLIDMITILPQLLKHQLLTGDEAYKCLSPTIPPQQKAHELLSYLKHKENEVLQKLLCSLCKETTHAGHKDVATVLQDAMRSHNLEFGQICSLCKEDAISAKGTTSKILNHITPDFADQINLDSLTPILISHHLLTESEVFMCESPYFSQGLKAQHLLLYLQRKGDKAAHKLLCCLNKETSHSGHNELAVKLKHAMNLYSFESELVCSVCISSEEPSANLKPDILIEAFDKIRASYPAEKWEGLASVLNFSRHDIEQISDAVTDNAHRVTMILQLWRTHNPEATEENFVSILRDANLGSVLQM